MSKNKLNEHPLHIRTTKRTIIDQALWFAREVDYSLVYVIAEKYLYPDNDEEYIKALFSTCFRLHMISRMIYKGKDGISKLSKERYRIILFECFAESMEEVESWIRQAGFEATDELTLHVFNCLRAMEDIVSHFVSRTYDIIYPQEFAGIINYIVTNNGDVPKPEFAGGIFPNNYDSKVYEFDFKVPCEER